MSKVQQHARTWLTYKGNNSECLYVHSLHKSLLENNHLSKYLSHLIHLQTNAQPVRDYLSSDLQSTVACNLLSVLTLVDDTFQSTWRRHARRGEGLSFSSLRSFTAGGRLFIHGMLLFRCNLNCLGSWQCLIKKTWRRILIIVSLFSAFATSEQFLSRFK